jgi:hypothetical protein
VSESTELDGASRPRPFEFSGAVVGFDVFDRNGERVGKVVNVNLARTCILVGTSRSLFGRKESHAVHASAVKKIDLDAFAIILWSSKQEVVDAPKLHDLDDAAEEAVSRYYERLAVPAEVPEGGLPL